jgi:hypothetical protein
MKYSPSRLGHPGQGRSLNRLHLPRFADACMGRRDPFQFVTSVTRPTRPTHRRLSRAAPISNSACKVGARRELAPRRRWTRCIELIMLGSP